MYIGTAGYYYDDWIGPVYPRNTRKSDFLRLYASEFKFTEINSSFYRLPNKHMFHRLRQKTPPDFQFAVKAYRAFTHERVDGPYGEFREALAPLLESGQLGCVLAQFPYSFKYTPANVAYLLSLRERFIDLPLVIEFRHASWITERVFTLLQENRVGYVMVDLPRLGSLPPRAVAVTGEIAYIRFHGRNARAWWHHTHPYERYDYLYTEEELKQWVPAIRAAEKKARNTFVSFNNHYRGKAVINARLLMRLLEIQEGAKEDGNDVARGSNRLPVR